jgi:DNA-binding PadR family transcriptional regulator
MKAYHEGVGVRVSTGNVYRELQRLMAQGLVMSAQHAEVADPRQTPYVITAAGVAEFDAWFVSPASVANASSPEDQLSARVLLLDKVPTVDGRRVLEAWQSDLWLRAKTLERARDLALAGAARSDRRGFSTLPFLLARHIRRVTADLAVLEELREAFDAWVTAQSGAEGKGLDARTEPSPPARRTHARR